MKISISGSRCSQELNIKGYRVPKGSIIVSCIWSIHNDPRVFEDPDEFRPERFLRSGEDGELRVFKPDNLIPFSFGEWFR